MGYGIWDPVLVSSQEVLGGFVSNDASEREPEFLPFPITGKLVRRKNSGTDETRCQNMDDVKGEDLDLEAADFLMTTKKLTSPLAERSRTQRHKKQRVV